MKITTFPAAQLSQEHWTAWSEVQRSEKEFDSPYFRPEFTQAVAAVRNDVEVGVLEQAGEMVGFFPYQRARGIARPVGGRLSDFQGVIVRRNVEWNLVELLKRCRLKAWHFDHAVSSQQKLHPYHRHVEDSPYADFSDGFTNYAAQHVQCGGDQFPNITEKARKLERRIGPLRFEAETNDTQVFDTLLRWKQQQYVRSGATNVFSFAWTRAVLERIFGCREEAFAGTLCALYAGEKLMAAHFGMRSYGVQHYWFPSYATEFAKFSPGMVRDLEFIKSLAAMGCRRLDFGKGMDQHKQYFMSGASQVAVGSVDLRPVRGIAQRQWHRAYAWARRSPLRKPARVPARVLYRIREWFAFQ
ncbi:MAG TPA: GNAT family N-acetyltransferase [Pirellulales bacterium]|jgi:CelD/BcsL family acetyltransferase involved in cellulose biosynthesis|nr:GNAT family N-acetyltransferase [Pirellulales bacterium]